MSEPSAPHDLASAEPMVEPIIEPMAEPIPAGAVIAGRFVVHGRAGEGGMGRVYRAVDLMDERTVALKVMRASGEPSARSGLEAGLEGEAELLASLRHPAIVSYVAHGQMDDGQPYLAMEWIEGETLAKALRSGPLPVRTTIVLALRLAHGLAVAHRVGVVHRDIKPSNILLPGGDVRRAKVADFGIAQYTHYAVSRGGTPEYMAPEILQKVTAIDARADVFSLGRVIHECLSGNLEPTESVATATAPWVGDERLVLPRREPSTGVDELDALLSAMVSVRREARPANADAVIAAIRGVLGGGDLGGETLAGLSAAGLPDVDPGTAALLDAALELRALDDHAQLVRERPKLGGERLLHGPAAPWIGRRAERDRLLEVYEDALLTQRPAAVLVHGEPGIGKSRFVREVLRAVAANAEPPLVWVAESESLEAGSAPFSMLSRLVHGVVGVVEGESASMRQGKLHTWLTSYAAGEDLVRLHTFLSELIRAPLPTGSSVMLRVARQDPSVMAAQTLRAWRDLVGLVARERRLVILLDDCQWVDVASLRYCRELLSLQDTRGLVIVTCARSGAVVWPTSDDTRLTRIEIGALSELESAEYVRAALGPDVDEELVESLVGRAQGNPLFLDELVRAVDDRRALPGESTVRALLRARLHALDAEALSVLRAASVFGTGFWLDGVVAVWGAEADPAVVREWLAMLTEAGLIVESAPSRFPGQEEYRFRHALMRDATYDTLPPASARDAHRTAARWLEAHGEANSVALGEHHRLGDEPKRAARCYLELARQALSAGELAAVAELTDVALACGADAPERGHLHLLRAEVEGCFGRHAEAASHASAAMRDLPPGSPRWVAAAGEAGLAMARMGDPASVFELVRALDGVELDILAGGVEITGLVRAALALVSANDAPSGIALVEVLDRMLSPHVGANPGLRASLQSARALKALCEGKLGDARRALDAASSAFEAAGDLRNAWEHRVAASFARLELGLLAEAERVAAEVLPMVRQAGLLHLEAVAKHNLGRRIAEAGRTYEGLALEHEALEAFSAHGNVRMEGLTRAFLARIKLDAGHTRDAELDAKEALRLLPDRSPSRTIAYATLAHVLLRCERPAEALEASTKGYDLVRGMGMAMEGEVLTIVAHAEALWASGRRSAAQDVIREARALVSRRAESLTELERESFLSGVPENARAIQLAETWAREAH